MSIPAKAMFLLLAALQVSAFQPGTKSAFCQHGKQPSFRPVIFSERSTTLLNVAVGDAEKLEDDTSKVLDDVLNGINLPEEDAEAEYADESTPEEDGDLELSNVQYAALEPGTVVHIQVGDLSLARKAWKKRRRSGSPLLVPCSVLNVDRASTVRWNLIYLLEKFGTNKINGLQISFAALNQRHRSHLKYSLQKHATSLGFETSAELIEHLFNQRAQETYGVKLVVDDDGMNWLRAPLSRYRAQKRANKAAVLQFCDSSAQDDTMKHSGIVRNKNHDRTEGENYYRLQPLSAALRVSQKEDVESGTIHTGSLHAAVVFDYDPAGDAGAPLLTLSLNPSRNQVRDRLKIVDRKHKLIRNAEFNLNEMQLGDGPIKGKVVRVIRGGVLVDCGVGRKVSSGNSQDMAQVLGYLRFKDAIENESTSTVPKNTVGDLDEDDDGEEEEEDWEEILSIEDLDISEEEEEEEGDEEEIDMSAFDFDNDPEFADSEDITHLFEIGEDGSLIATDEETGESQILASTGDDGDEDGPVVFSRSRNSHHAQPSVRKRLTVGDEVEVFVKSVSRQSSRLLLTTSSELKGKRAIDVKRSTEIEKKLARLEKQLGGLSRIHELEGKEMNGVVKALSNTGDWLYVQPNSDEGLPVGVATIPEGEGVALKQGDSVVVRLEGIDQTRGQLSLKVLQKLSP